jgi:hypothetical protein
MDQCHIDDHELKKVDGSSRKTESFFIRSKNMARNPTILLLFFGMLSIFNEQKSVLNGVALEQISRP